MKKASWGASKQGSEHLFCLPNPDYGCVASSSYLDFPSIMDCNLQLWDEKTSPLRQFLLRCFITVTNETKIGGKAWWGTQYQSAVVEVCSGQELLRGERGLLKQEAETAQEARSSSEPQGQDPASASVPHYLTWLLYLKFTVSLMEVPSICQHMAGPGFLLVDKCLRD